jgi:hypothetical protein
LYDNFRIHKINKEGKLNLTEEKTNLVSEEIARIQNVIEGKETDEGKKNCLLCLNFSCLKCPVHEKTGHVDCSETPYDGWVNHQLRFHLARTNPLKVIPGCPACRKYLEDWVLFLKSLKNG